MDIINTYVSIRYSCLFTPLLSSSSTALITSAAPDFLHDLLFLILVLSFLFITTPHHSIIPSAPLLFRLLNVTAPAPWYSAPTPHYPAPVPPAVSAPPYFLAPPATSAIHVTKAPLLFLLIAFFSYHQVYPAPPSNHNLTELPPLSTFPSPPALCILPALPSLLSTSFSC